MKHGNNVVHPPPQGHGPLHRGFIPPQDPTTPGTPASPGYVPSGGPLPPGFSAPQAPMMMHTTPGAPAPPGYTPLQAPVMMPVSDRPQCCPPGLEYLTQIDQLLAHQKVNMAEVVLGFEMNNAYIVKNSVGRQVFTAYKENDCLTLQCCGPSRPFTILIQDNLGQEVLTLTRPLRCSACCFPCCLQELEVQNPPGNPIGYVVQHWHPFLPEFTVLNEVREPQINIKGPFLVCSCGSDVIFMVLSLEESSEVGQISKQWRGLFLEACTDADNFGISFPMDLDVKMKAVMLGACFLIDNMYFERRRGNQYVTMVNT